MKHKLFEELKVRNLEYLNSNTFKDILEYSKGEYWELHAFNIKIIMKSDTIKAQGKPGFYAIPKKLPFYN